MLTTTLHPDLHQDCLDKLSQVLDLILKTAEAASADHNHKLVIQAAREATRITTLIFKMTNPKTKSAPASRAGATAPTVQTAAPAPAAEPGLTPADFLLPDLDTLFPPRDSWDGETRDIYNNITRNYQELQAIGNELAAGLPDTGKDNGTNG